MALRIGLILLVWLAVVYLGLYLVLLFACFGIAIATVM